MTINVVVADDHEVVRKGLSSLLDDTEIKIVGEASDGDEAVEQTLKHEPDLVLMDIRMNQRDGISALERIRKESPDTRVLMLSTYDNPTYVARSAALGAVDYVLKGSPRKELIGAIQRAMSDEGPAPESLMNRVRNTMARRTDRSDDIPLETVKEHVQNILRKLDVNDRTQAAVWAVRKGLV